MSAGSAAIQSRANDRTVLDAFSQAVISVVERVSPSVDREVIPAEAS